jgi:hypothetical protein
VLYLPYVFIPNFFQVTHHIHSPKPESEENSYYGARNIIVKKDGISEREHRNDLDASILDKYDKVNDGVA